MSGRRGDSYTSAELQICLLAIKRGCISEASAPLRTIGKHSLILRRVVVVGGGGGDESSDVQQCTVYPTYDRERQHSYQASIRRQ
jgi:hypothetical protein